MSSSWLTSFSLLLLTGGLSSSPQPGEKCSPLPGPVYVSVAYKFSPKFPDFYIPLLPSVTLQRNARSFPHVQHSVTFPGMLHSLCITFSYLLLCEENMYWGCFYLGECWWWVWDMSPCALYLLHLWVSLQLSLHGSAISEAVLACFVGAVIYRALYFRWEYYTGVTEWLPEWMSLKADQGGDDFGNQWSGL